MKMRIILIVATLTSVLLIWYAYILISGTDLFTAGEQKSRPDSIPKSTYYLGGSDGGVWIDTLRRSDTLMLVVIYSEYGKIMDSTWLSTKPSQDFTHVLERVQGYNGEKLIMKEEQDYP